MFSDDGTQPDRAPVIALLLMVIGASIIFVFLSFLKGNEPDQAAPTLAFYNQVVEETQQAKRDYAQKHGIPLTGSLSPLQLDEVIDQFDYPRDNAGNFLYAGGRAIKVNPMVNALPDLVEAQVEETDPCEILISEIHSAVKDYAELHGIPYDATLTAEQIQEISDSIELPKNEVGDFVCPNGESVKINPIVRRRPGRVNKILFDLGGKGKP